MSEDPIIPTRVGHASWGDNLFRGYSVDAELAGTLDLWNVVSLSLGGPRLDRDDLAILDDVTTSGLAADPRIWPMKMVRLASAYGRPIMGLGMGLVGIERAPVGTQTARQMAQLLVEIGERVEGGSSIPEEVERVLARQRRFPGFGVPFREEDERVVTLRRCLERRGRAGGRYWTLVQQLGVQLSIKRRLAANFSAAIASVLLDLGFTPEQAPMMATFMMLPNYFANAWEGARSAPDALQRLPDHAIEYVGATPRTSPRAREHSRAEGERGAPRPPADAGDSEPSAP